MKKLILALAVTLFAGMAFAQSIAIINMEEIYKCEYIVNLGKEIDTTNQIYQQEMKIRQENIFLGENEITELISLVAKKGDQNKIKEYTDTNAKRFEEYQTLSQTKELNEEQKKRQTELTNINKKAKENYENRGETLSQSLKSLIETKEEEMLNIVKSTCEKVAKDKKMSIVIEKSLVFYGGTDITNDVIKAFGSKK